MWLVRLIQRMTLMRQNALSSHTWNILLSPPLYRWGKIDDDMKMAWIKLCADEVNNP